MDYSDLILRVIDLKPSDDFSLIDGWVGNKWIEYIINKQYKSEQEIIFKSDLEKESHLVLENIRTDTSLFRYWVSLIIEDENYKKIFDRFCLSLNDDNERLYHYIYKEYLDDKGKPIFVDCDYIIECKKELQIIYDRYLKDKIILSCNRVFLHALK